jgi:hypothetical protein
MSHNIIYHAQIESMHVALEQQQVMSNCLLKFIMQLREKFFDMDMSYARRVRTASLTSYPVRCKILHQRTASLS